MSRMTIAVELDPPVTAVLGDFMDGARRLRASGADAITLADNPLAKARADSALLAAKLQRETLIPAIPHLTCRDRNRNALRSTLLGLAIEGIETVLAVTGDPVPEEDREEVRKAFAGNSEDLARLISAWNRELFERPFRIAGALNVNAPRFDAELRKAERKRKAGVSLFFTQPVLSALAVQNIRRAREALGAQLYGGLLPPVNHRNALFLAEKVSGISVESGIAEKFRDLGREEGEEMGLRVALEMAESIMDSVDGFYLITPFKRVGLMVRLVEELRALEHRRDAQSLFFQTDRAEDTRELPGLPALGSA